MNYLMEFLNNEDGVTAIEYALIAALIAVVIIAAVMFAGEQVSRVFQVVADTMAGAS